MERSGDDFVLAMVIGSIIDGADRERDRIEAEEAALVEQAFDVFGPFCRCERCVALDSWHGGWFSLKCWFLFSDATNIYGCLKGDRKISFDHPKWESNILAAKAYKENFS